MAYLLIENFKGGLDSRRGLLTSKAGTLHKIANAHITRGGEMERRRAFVKYSDLPAAQTFGLHSVDGNIYVFGSSYSPSVPPGVNYQQLIHPDGVTQLNAIISTDNFNGAIYAIARFADGAIYHYYDGKRVTSWDTIVDETVTPVASNSDIATYLASLIDADSNFSATATGNDIQITASATNTPFTATLTATAGGSGSPTLSQSAVQSAAAAIAEVLARTGNMNPFGTGVGGYSSFRINGQEVLGSSISLHDESNAGNNLSGRVNSYQGVYTCVPLGSPWYFQAKPGSGATPNGYDVYFNSFRDVPTTWGDPSVSSAQYGLVGNGGRCGTFYGGVAPVAAAAQVTKVTVGGTFDFDNVYTIQLNIPSTSYSATFTVTRKYNSENNTAVAQSLARKINLDPKVYASYLDSRVIVTARQNNYEFDLTTSFSNGTNGSIVMSKATLQATSATQPKIMSVSIGGGYASGNKYNVLVSSTTQAYNQMYSTIGQATGMGTVCKTFGTKMYVEASNILWFSQINDPTKFDLIQTNGSGFINMSNQDAGSEILSGLGVYQGRLAVFARRTTQVWSIDADPTKNAKTQTLSNIGTVAARSIVNYGDLNLFYLADIGIRSLVPRDASNNATISDVGTNIDNIVQSNVSTLDPDLAANACAIMEPIDGRYWLAVGLENYVYSYFPNGQISAWSTYYPGFVIEQIVYCGGLIYVRSGDSIYAFGGRDGQTYDDCRIEIELPFLDGGKPANIKKLTAFDMECQGTWDIYIGCDPSNPDAKQKIGTVTGETYSLLSIPAEGLGTHIGVKLVNTTPGYARVGNMAVHFQDLGDVQ